MKYFLIWSDWDGNRVEEFADEAVSLQRIAELYVQHPNDSNGFGPPVLLRGERLAYEPYEKVVVFRLKKPE